MQPRRKWPGRETAPTSEEGEDAQQGHQKEPMYGDREADSHVFHPATRTGGRTTVEMPAPAEAEEVTP
jgi:hypothetical protein